MNEPTIMTAPEAARFLRISESTLRRRAKTGIIPSTRVLGPLRFHKTDLEKLVKQ